MGRPSSINRTRRAGGEEHQWVYDRDSGDSYYYFNWEEQRVRAIQD